MAGYRINPCGSARLQGAASTVRGGRADAYSVLARLFCVRDVLGNYGSAQPRDREEHDGLVHRFRRCDLVLGAQQNAAAGTRNGAID